MKWDAATARAAFVRARVARLATAAVDGQPHLVPVVFAVSDTDVLHFAVDGKPKSTSALKRLDNIAANPRVSLLVDHYDDDWTQLWWACADGIARISDGVEANGGLELLTARYPQYRETPPPGPVVAVEISRWSGWSAGAGPQ